ncbi:MAG: sulfurtransferase [Sulfurospirillaceae bacterium]|nr:sulfurtransferase [Sulfurospirillaceae bacterium]
MRYFFSFLFNIVCAMFMFLSSIANADSTLPIDTRGYAHNDLLVSVDWVKENLNNDKVFLIDARGDDAYGKEHIPGAISATWQAFSDLKAPKGKGFAMLLEQSALTKKFQEFGIDDKKTIVLYADPNGWGEDGRIVWMLRMAGLNNTKILDGGWPAWKKAKGSTTTTKTTPTPSDFTIKTINTDMLATTDWIVANRKEIIVLDTRSQKEWDGATDYKEPRGGHIKDAIRIQWSDFFNIDSTIKTQTQINDIMNKAGVKKSDTIALYCTSGIRSAHMTLMLRMAGYAKAKNYAASINEWGALSDLPMEK